MTSPRLANFAFLTLTALVIAGTAISIAWLWPAAVSAAHSQAGNLVQAGQAAGSAREAEIDFKLALKLDSNNLAARLGLAKTQIAAGQADAALTTLELAGEGSEAAQLRLRTLIELGRIEAAASRTSSLAQPGRADTDIVLAGLVYALAGRTADTYALIPLVASPQAAQSLSRAGADKLTLAQELYATGLPESSRVILVKLPATFERNVLLGRIHNDRHTTADLAEASRYLETAIKINPADAAAHRILAKVYSDQGLINLSEQQSKLAKKLETGRP